MADFKLTYFNAGGRAELTRLIFAKSGTKFEDERIEFADWPKKKAKMPMGTMPVLRYQGQDIIQSLIIARFAARKCGLVGRSEMDEFYCDMFVSTLMLDIGTKLVEAFFEKDPVKKAALVEARYEPTAQGLVKLVNMVKGEFVLGDVMSYADLAIMDAETMIHLVLPECQLPAKLQAIIKKVRADPPIAAYLASRPKTRF